MKCFILIDMIVIKTAANRVRLFIKSIEAREFEPLEGIIKDCYRSRNVVACINHKRKS